MLSRAASCSSGGGVRSISSSSGSPMSKAPYPGYDPKFKFVPSLDGFTRTCYVLELLSEEPLDEARRAQLEDQIGFVVQKFVELHKHDLVRSDRFDTDLRRAMRL